MADKFHSDIQEKVETILYQPSLQDSGDFEPGTKTITATEEASGLGNADYNASLTLAKPDDARLVVKRITSRLAVTIDSMTAGHLYCRVYVDQQDADHRLFAEDWASIGAKLAAVDTHSGNKSTIFNLLKDGSAHTIYFFFLVDSGNAVISTVQLQEGAGSSGTANNVEAIRLIFKGLIHWTSAVTGAGSGTQVQKLVITGSGGENTFRYYIAPSANSVQSTILVSDPTLAFYSTVATDITCLKRLAIILRSEQ